MPQFYNKRHGRRGFFWGDRFKSLIVQNGDTLINCPAYIDWLCRSTEGFQRLNIVSMRSRSNAAKSPVRRSTWRSYKEFDCNI
jgi:hypothetical protein